MTRLTRLVAGQEIPFGGDRIAVVDEKLASEFRVGDRLVVVQETGDLIHIPEAEHAIVQTAVTEASAGFAELSRCSDDQISDFFDRFAARLADGDVMRTVSAANDADVARARERGRSTTRLEMTESMRDAMVEGLQGWRDADVRRDAVVETVVHEGWTLEARRAPLGVVAFVFEGRPNVFADASGVVRSGNAVVFRIGSDALGTARAIMEHAVTPALAESGLPAGAIRLVESASRSAGHALFSDSRIALAVARGSGQAVAQLGAVASQSGVPVSLHGTGGAWIVASEHADAARLHSSIRWSLDRKVCNTVNCVALVRSRAADLVAPTLDALAAAAAARNANGRLHVVEGSETYVPAELFDAMIDVERAEGLVTEPQVSSLAERYLAVEWEWENSPEMTLVVVDSVEDAVSLFAEHSPHFVASLVSDDPDEHDRFYAAVDAPFVGDGFTRWVDGQYALDKPELGLSNWQRGRMLGRSGILSGDSVHTIRCRATITDPTVRR